MGGRGGEAVCIVDPKAWIKWECLRLCCNLGQVEMFFYLNLIRDYSCSPPFLAGRKML